MILAQIAEPAHASHFLCYGVLIGLVVVLYLAARGIASAVRRSVKARQDLARGVADLADRMERLEKKLGEDRQAKL